MPYQRVNWQDGPSGGTPLSAENLNKMDEAIADAFAILDAATAAVVGNTIVRRDASGRSKFATPIDSADAATKGYVDGLVTVRARAHAGTYNGNGAATRPINFGWRPRFVVMMTRYEDVSGQYFDIFLRIDGAPYTARINSVDGSNVRMEPISSLAIGITDTGFTVNDIPTNVSGRTYYYVAIG